MTSANERRRNNVTSSLTGCPYAEWSLKYPNGTHGTHCAVFACGYRPVDHDYVIKWKHFRRNWPFVRGIHRVPVNSPHRGQWRGALMRSLICVSINCWVNNREAGDLRRHRGHYDVNVMFNSFPPSAAYMRQCIGLALVQIMVCRLFGAKPLSKPMLGYCQLDL